MKKYMPIRANRARMKKEFDAQSTIGRYGKTGLARIALTPEYNQVRDLVRGWMEEAGLKTRVDAVGNLFGRKQGGVKGLPVVMAGSHLDSQNPGGRFDGPAGVLTALEAVRRIAEVDALHDHPLEVVAFVGEESACGVVTFGSSILAGQLGAGEMKRAVHPPTGKSVWEAIRLSGGRPERFKSCKLSKKNLKAFLELHIEQGPILETAKVPIGIVDTVVGALRGDIFFEGQTAHSGGQPMLYRRDAAMAAAAFMVEIEAAVRRAPERHRMTLTFGMMSAQLGWYSIVPGGAKISFDLRSKSDAASRAMLGRIKKTLLRIEKKRGVKGRVKLSVKYAACPASMGIRRALKRAAGETEHSSLTLSSGGIHDACRIAALCPIGMVFVPSVKGLSHTPEEFTKFSDIVAGAEVMASAILGLADRRVRA
ncbi:MAG: Zn-dependent hydrolase [Nitrospinaceae bacterium]|nr:Zn-dependent hydrolase [Nitrospinaceae bacterium]